MKSYIGLNLFSLSTVGQTSTASIIHSRQRSNYLNSWPW